MGKLAKYWHLQMHLPYGRGEEVINPRLMLQEAEPIIGTGEWPDFQCANFKQIANGNVVLVRQGSRAIALCELVGENFTDAALCDKYGHRNFRRVKILGWADDYVQPRVGLFTQGTFGSCGPRTEQYKYIDKWLKHINEMDFVNRCARLLRAKHNLILQGAPGTGKTYNTAALALKIIGEDDIDLTDHKAVMERYKKLQDDRIFFTTFHQSLDYEDFVEGLKPRVHTDCDGNATGVTYEPEDGIFKRACMAVHTNESADILECVDAFLQKIKGFEHRRQIPTVTGRSALYVWWKEGNQTVSSRSVNSTIPADEDSSPSPLNIEKIKLQAVGMGVENNWPYYAQAFIEAAKREARVSTDKPVVLIIDEINRGNVSKIFGELITLLEADKRDGGEHPVSVTLPYTKTLFTVPSNLYIIGTMNTTDRSTGTLDYALRRRFCFVTLAADASVVREHYAKRGQTALGEKAVALFDDIRRFIDSPDHQVGEQGVDDLMVGHSYFLANNEDELRDRVSYEIVPLITEYINDGLLNVTAAERREAFEAWRNLQPRP